MAEPRYRIEYPEGGEQKRVGQQAGGRPTLLRIPDAPHRPGDEPRFARFTYQPEDLTRPEPQAHFEQLHPHASGLVRVLDDEGRAAGAWNPQLGTAELRSALKSMVHTRAFDRRMLTMQRQGRLSFFLESAGEEAVAIGAGLALREDDLLFPSYRQQGLFLLRGMPLLQMMCQCIGNQGDVCKGRQMPVHYSWKKGNLVSISSPVGTQFPQAVGAAMATAYRGEHNIVATWVGEGTTAQGDFHYALNFASVYMPPVILNVVNNQWAISTHRNLATGGKTFAARGEPYGIPGIRVDGNDFLAVYAVTQWAAQRARLGAGPTLIELLTYRAGAHSTSDDPSRYRPSDEARLWPGGDPIARLAQHLTLAGEWSDQKQQELEESAQRRVLATYKKAESIGSLATGPTDPPETIVEDVYKEIPAHLKRQREELAKRKKNKANREE